MKVVPDEKTLLTKQTLSSSLRKATRREERDAYKCKKILRRIVEGKVVTVILSLVTVYALIGVLFPSIY